MSIVQNILLHCPSIFRQTAHLHPRKKAVTKEHSENGGLGIITFKKLSKTHHPVSQV